MKFRILSACALVCALALGAAAAQDASKQAQAKPPSGGEREAAQKIEKAQGTAAKLQMAAAFIKKYPQSSLRKQIAEALAREVSGATDAKEALSLAQTYADIFDLPEEKSQVTAALLNGYINTGQTEQAMKMGTGWLAQHPDDISTLQNLTILASTEIINKKNTAYVAQGRQYAAKAIELLEADKMPAGFDAARWPDYRKNTLVAMYREAGVLAHLTGDRAAARPLLEKSAALRSPDPSVYLLLAGYATDEYNQRQKEYTVASPAEKPAALKTAEAALDNLIETYARAVAMTEGDARFQQANAGIREDLEKNYKFRHNNSADGLQQLIDKYKKPAQ